MTKQKVKTIPMEDKNRLLIRWMIRRDMADVYRIEQASYLQPWREEDFLRCLRQRNCIGMVAEKNDIVTSYMVYELLPGKVHVLNFAVDPVERMQGIGRCMIEKLKAKLSVQHRKMLTIVLPERNYGGLVFLKSQGFVAVKLLKDYFDDQDDDAILMRFTIDL